jgi:hypothetical protein
MIPQANPFDPFDDKKSFVPPTIEKTVTMTPDEVMTARNAQYGAAWLLTGRVWAFIILDEYTTLLQQTGYFFNWFIILNKLIRAIASPQDRDHWVDIRNYAELVVKHMDRSDTGSSYRS